MPPVETLLIFTGAALIMNISPGPSNFYVMSRSMSQGVWAGIISAVGLACGSMVHVAAATLGVSAILMTSSTAFAVLKYVGAAYLIWLGIQCIRNSDTTMKADHVTTIPKSKQKIFFESATVEILNPKVAIFFLAFLPQFVDPTLGSVTTQFLVLGLIITLSGLPCDMLIALTSGSAARAVEQSATLRRTLDWISGGVLIGVGAFVALADD